MLSEGDCKDLILGLDGGDEVGKTLAGFFFDILVRMLFDDGAKEIDCLLDIWVVHLFQLFDEDI